MIVSVLLMDLKSIAFIWKNIIIFISLVIDILYNTREVFLVVLGLLNEKIASVLWTIFCLREKQRGRVVREELETGVDLFPFFGLN